MTDHELTQAQCQLPPEFEVGLLREKLGVHAAALKRAKKALWRIATEEGIPAETRQAIAAEALTEVEEMVPTPGPKIGPLVADLTGKAPKHSEKEEG